MPDLDPAAIFAPRFNALGAPWAATGSIASMVYGEIRTTQDIDIIVLLDSISVARLESVFPEAEFYRPHVMSSRWNERAINAVTSISFTSTAATKLMFI